MLTANELRIGNWIQGYHSPYDLDQVTAEHFSTVDADGNINGEPIGLTEEWLLKFGFERTNSSLKVVIDNDDYFRIKWTTSGRLVLQQYYEPEIELSHIKFVHQLQNLYFSLVGKELEIKQPVTS